MRVLITGAAGFIGSNFTNFLTENNFKNIFCLDKLGYASNLNYINGLPINFEKIDLLNKKKLNAYINIIKPEIIINFAAESHVDNSILNSESFIDNNIKGTVNLLEACKYRNIKKFIHISTDEVFGSIKKGKFHEKSRYNPLNPYSASKASSEQFILAYGNTFKFPFIITNCCNNYGPRQHSEKLIPKTILNFLNNKKIGIYGNGMNIREWIHVKDHCEALLKIMVKGKTGKRYLIGGSSSHSNLYIVKKISKLLNKDFSNIKFIKDRKGHDYRYSINSIQTQLELNWKPKIKLAYGLKETVKWYENNKKLFK